MSERNFRRRDLLIGAGAMTVAAPWVHAQSSLPKFTRVLVAFPPGQATDITTRYLAEKMAPLTGENYVVENKPGQGGSMGLAQLAKSPNDGSTMIMAHMSAVATNPHMYKSVGYDTRKDFEAVGLAADLPFVMVVNASLPIKNVADLVKYAKANPDKLTNASSGNGTVSHLAMEEFKRAAGVKILHVPYQGSARSLVDVISGEVSMALETAASVLPHVQSGKLRAIAAGSTRRLQAPLDVPTMQEQGFANFSAVTWLMLLYPAGTDKSHVNRTFKALDTVMNSPEVEQKLLSIGALPRRSKSPEEAAAYVQSEFKHWGEVVARNGVKLD